MKYLTYFFGIVIVVAIVVAFTMFPQPTPPEPEYSVEISVDGKVVIQHIPVSEVLHIVMDNDHFVNSLYTIETKELK